MARFLFAAQPGVGHVAPMLPVVSRLARAGHEVVWYCGEAFRSKIEAAGAAFTPFREALDVGTAAMDELISKRAQLKGLAQVRFDLTHLFFGQIGRMHRDLQAILREFPADVVVADPTILAAQTLREAGGPPNAVFSITVLGMESRDVAPFGFGLAPSATPLGRLRNRALHALFRDLICGPARAELRRQRASVGVAPEPFGMFAESPFLTIQPSVPALEYPRSDLPDTLHFIGALLPDAPASFTPPAWWEEATAGRRRVVLVTQGTVAAQVRELIAPTLRALAHEQDLLVIAAGVDDLAELGPIPANARVEQFVPFKPLLPHVDVYVTNGGFGGLHYALANGVPVVGAGTTEDKTEVNARIAYSGVGINLKTSTPTPAQVRAAVLRVLREPGYRERARAVQAELTRHDASAEAVALLERLAATGEPVRRLDTAVEPRRTFLPFVAR